MTELDTPFGNLFLKVADFQLKCVKNAWKRADRSDIYSSKIAFPLGEYCCLGLVNNGELFYVNKSSTMNFLESTYSERVKEFTLFSSDICVTIL